MSGVSWLIALIGLACFCSGAFAFVTHRMLWQRAGDGKRPDRPVNAGMLLAIGAPAFFIPLVNSAPDEYRVPLGVVAAVAVVAVVLILRRLEKKRWT